MPAAARNEKKNETWQEPSMYKYISGINNRNKLIERGAIKRGKKAGIARSLKAM